MNSKKSPFIKDALALENWYLKSHRPLPWRADKDPYRIWISEIMLQQTTVAAVVPFYERFMEKFPKIETLARSEESEVLSMWAGLGYYSRARNLYKSAKALSQSQFPRSYKELIQYPGLGPYTARAVTSIAFDEPVGVVDGNVIRVLSRRWGHAWQWWKTSEREQIQDKADQLAQQGTPSIINQAIMELGATVCTKESPLCHRCPWLKSCVARSQDTIKKLPLIREKSEKKLWIYEPFVRLKRNKVLMEIDLELLVIGKMWLLPGTVKKVTKKPKNYTFTHSVTNNIIYVSLPKKQDSESPTDLRPSQNWISLDDFKKFSHSSLTQKILTRVIT